MAYNDINIVDTPNIIVITDNEQNQVIVTAPQTRVVQVATPGPQGPKGDPGKDIDVTTLVTTSSFNTFTSSYNAEVAQINANIVSINNTYLPTASFNTFTDNYILDSASFQANIFQISSSLSTLSGSFTGSLFGTASYAIEAATASVAPAYVLTSSFNAFTSSYTSTSASISTRLTSNESSLSNISSSLQSRVTNLEQFSSSLDTVFATDSQLNAATASLSSSIALVDSRVSNVSSSYLSLSSSFRSGSFSGSFNGNGANLTNIPASAITGLNLSQIASGSATASISPNHGFRINTDTYITGSLTVSGSNTFRNIGPAIFSGSVIVTEGITSSLQGTSSYALSALTASYAINVQQINTGSLVTTSSFNAFTASYIIASSSISTRLSTNESNITTVSSSLLSLSSSYVSNSSSFNSKINSITSSLNVFTSSYNTGSFTGSFTGSVLANSLTASNALITGNVQIIGTASIAFLNVTYESASVIYSTGSNQFGDSDNDTQTLFGTVVIPTGSLLLSGSGIITGSLDVYQGITGSLFGTASRALTASNTVLQSSILTNQTVGALPSGTTLTAGTGLETILRTMLITYIPPTLSSLVMRNGGSNISTAARDVGDSFIVNTASFSATADNPTNIFPISASWTGSGADIGTQTFYFGDNVLSTSNVRSIGGNYTINRATTNGTVTFTVNGRRSDTGAAITGATTSVAFQWRNYLAASSTIPTDNASAQTVVNASVQSALDTDRAWTATCTAANDTTGNFTYIIYPSSYGTLSNIIQNGALSVLSAFTNLGTFTVTNAFGASILVRIYKSNSDKAFASGTTLAIS